MAGSKALAFVLGGLFLTSLAIAKEWWEEKPLTEWSEKDVKRMLDNSPWGKIHTITILNPTASSPGSRSFADIGRGDLEREKQNLFHLRFLTAKPIRIAVARNAMLRGRSEISASILEKFIAQEDEDNIVLAMEVTAIPEGSSSLRGYWTALMNLRTTDLSSITTLTTKSGKRVYLARYEPPGRDGLGAKFYFPRRLPDGRPLITGDDREIRFETTITLSQHAPLRGQETNVELAPQLEHQRTDRIWMKFDVRKMIFEGKIEI